MTDYKILNVTIQQRAILRTLLIKDMLNSNLDSWEDQRRQDKDWLDAIDVFPHIYYDSKENSITGFIHAILFEPTAPFIHSYITESLEIKFDSFVELINSNKADAHTTP